MNKLSRLVAAHTALLKKLLNEALMVPGTYGEVFVKCGKENCWCKEKKGHLFRRITWSENGVSKTKSIPEKDIPWIIEATRNYRIFRKMKRELLALESKIKLELHVWENKQVKKSRKKKKMFQKSVRKIGK